MTGGPREASPQIPDRHWRDVLWGQFGAAIQMLENAVLACPHELWGDRARRPEIWHLVYHTLFWLDLYLHGSVEGFAPPAPFALTELDPAGVPERPFSKDELRKYLEHGRARCRTWIESMTPETARRSHEFRWGKVSGAELLLYNMRHVQHHAAQLNLILRQTTDSAPRWVARRQRSDDSR